MKKKLLPLLHIVWLSAYLPLAHAATPVLPTPNRPPLIAKPYLDLPLGSIQPQGWLLGQLQTMASGLTGRLDELYPQVVGPRNGWLGGDGDGWERGPYWIDGLLPLAYILGDKRLIAKTKPWVEWCLTHQQENGYFGPDELVDPIPEPGLQKTQRRDWWPKMVMLKVLMQYHSVTQDPRVMDLMRRYFLYQLQELPKTPLDHWTIWANRRGGDNLMAVYWLYNLTGEKFLLKLADLVFEQTFPWTRVFLNDRPTDFYQAFPSAGPWIYELIRYPWKDDEINALSLKSQRTFHCVNVAQGIKQPVVYYQQHPETKYLTAVKQALADLQRYHGQAQGLFGADEPLHGNDPTQGIELCSVVEFMFSLETMLAITGEVAWADQLEKIAFNALPTQSNDAYTSRQYFQTANQVLISRDRRNFFETENHGHTDLCYGLLTGYPCCTCNMHQGWPKFVQHLWFATADGGAAALIYAPSQVTFNLTHGPAISFTEETDYPFDGTIRFTYRADKSLTFPFYLRIPGWCEQATVLIHGQPEQTFAGNQIIRLSRTWHPGDRVELRLPLAIRTSRWQEASVALERGPLVFSLKIDEIWKSVRSSDKWGDYQEVYPADPWNFGLLEEAVRHPQVGFQIEKKEPISLTPWKGSDAPLQIKTKGKRIPEWQMYRNSAGPLPTSPVTYLQQEPSQEILLIPYGCTTLRITEFPVVR